MARVHRDAAPCADAVVTMQERAVDDDVVRKIVRIRFVVAKLHQSDDSGPFVGSHVDADESVVVGAGRSDDD